MDSEISEEELDTFLKEAGILNNPIEIQTKKAEPLDNLIEEIMCSIQASNSPPISTVGEKITSVFLEKEKQKRTKFPLSPLFISIAFLGGIFLGSIFGFYWGKTQRVEMPERSFEDIEAKVTLLVNQIQEISNKIVPVSLPEEIIEPMEPTTEIQKLIPERAM